ncbi:MAG: DUF2232 domain-containing protein [Clostridia bacterium]|nr:DUF2232 domain-containing protein [Clostridia bacterium]
MNFNAGKAAGSAEKQNNLKLAVFMAFLSCAMCAVSAFSGFAFTSFLAAAALSFILLRTNCPIAALISAAVSFGVCYLITSSPITASQIVLYAATGAVFALFKKKKVGFFKTFAALGLCFALITAFFAALSIRANYGEIVAGAKEIYNNYYNATFEYIKSAISVDDTVLLTDNEIRDVLSLATSILPGIAAAFAELIGAALYAICKVFVNVVSPNSERRYPGEYAIPRWAVVFFTVSFILSLIFSAISKLNPAHVTAMNLAVVLCVPVLFDGAFRLARKLKAAASFRINSGGSRPKTGFILAALVISAFFSIVFPFIILIVYSVAGTVKDIIKSGAAKK